MLKSAFEHFIGTNYMGYDLFHKFIQTYAPSGFRDINRNDALILELEDMTENGNQFFFIGDIVQMQIRFTSNRSSLMIGIDPDIVNPYHIFEVTHKDDLQHHKKAREKVFGLSGDLFIAGKGHEILSTNLRIRNSCGDYPNVLFQCYLFFSETPVRTVYILEVHTDIGWYKKLKLGYHYYLSNDLSWFRYPDEELLMKGNIFSGREFEIIKLVGLGLNSEQIGDKLFLSPHTVNKHRSNILKKSGVSHVSDLIYSLKEDGLL